MDLTQSTDFVELLEGFFADIEKVTGIGVVMHDWSFLTQLRLPLARYNHNCEYCRFIKSLPSGEQMCRRSDVEEALKEAQEADEPFLRYCHAGVSEVIVPVKADNRVLAVVFCGQVFQKGREGIKKAPVRVRKMVPCVQEEKLMAVGRIVHRFFVVNSNMIAAMADLHRPSQYGNRKLYDAIQALENEFDREVTVGDVARRVGLSVSHFEHLFKRHMTVNFTIWKRRRRIREALKLLTHTDLKVREVAEKVGFQDPAYFHRLFKRQTGMSPLEHRKMAARAGQHQMLRTEKA